MSEPSASASKRAKEVVDRARKLYTVPRSHKFVDWDGVESVIARALDAGEKVWDHSIEAEASIRMEFLRGPHAYHADCFCDFCRASRAAARLVRDTLARALDGAGRRGGGAGAERGAMRIYVASSWRNEHQPEVVCALRAVGHEVYDFRDHGFSSWRTVSGDWLSWTPAEYIAGLAHPEAEKGFARDMDALHWCEACVMVMPCGPSAALELGWAAGAGKPTAVYMPGIREPDLMIKVAELLTESIGDVVGWLQSIRQAPRP